MASQTLASLLILLEVESSWAIATIRSFRVVADVAAAAIAIPGAFVQI